MTTIHATDRTIPPVGQLAEICRELARVSDEPAARRAFERAATYVEQGLLPVLDQAGVMVPSATVAGRRYRTSATNCTCDAGRRRCCWHRAVVEALETIWLRRDAESDPLECYEIATFGDEAQLPSAPTIAEERALEREARLAAIYAAVDWY